MAQHHTIGKLSLELELPARQNALSLQDKLGAVCKDSLVYALQELLDSWTDAGTLLRVERLEIDLGECTPQQLERELPERIVSYLRGRYPALQYQPSLETGMERHPMTQGYFDSWLYFLEHGLLPDTSPVKDTAAWEAGVLEILSTATPALERCRRVLETQPAAINRMLLQFSRPFIRQWIQAYAGPAQQPLMQMAKAWEQCCDTPELLTQLRRAASIAGVTLPSLPGKTDFQRGLDEWCIQQILSASQAPEPATLLEQVIAVSFGAEHLPAYVQALQQLPSLPGEGAAVLKTALLTLHNRYVSAGKINHPVRPTAKDLTHKIAEAKTDDGQATASGRPQEQPAATAKATDTPPTSTDQQKDKSAPGTDQAASRSATSPDAAEQATENTHNPIPAISPAEQSGAGSGAAADPGQVAAADRTPAGTDKRAEQRKKPGTPPAARNTYINNAGLVLLHPYLNIFFNALGLLEKRAFKSSAAQDKAVQLLGFLASGETDIPEYDLVFPKLLCGLLPEDPVDRFVELTELDKTEANQLLEAVINNWNALGSTSADGLRGNFLMREGKLQWQSDEWRLRVTQASYDLLLNRLPWGISVVRLPWMPWALKTEWA
ncbi:MAG TPA: contractile injection system tape measure protein [Chitinophaga sp.]